MVAETIITICLGCVLARIGWEDVKELKIRDRWVFLLALISLVCIPFFPGIRLSERIAGTFLISVPMLLCALIRPGTIGGGDVKLMAAGGFLLGTDGILLAAFAGLFTAAVFCIVRIITGKALRKMRIPLGPFLGAGIFLLFLCKCMR